MQHLQLDNLRARLRKKGYSRRRIDRLCHELQDHYGCLLEEAERNDRPARSQEDCEAIAANRIGDLDDLIDWLEDYEELKPWTARFPVTVFVILPAVFTVVFSALTIHASAWLSSIDWSAEWKSNAIPWFQGVINWLPAVYLASLGVVCIRRYSSLFALPLAACILSLTGFFHIDLAACLASQSTYFHVDVGPSVSKIAPVWMAWLVCGCVALQRQLAGSNRVGGGAGERIRQVMAETRNRLTLPAWTRAGLALPLVIGVFLWAIHWSRDATEVHPADRLAKAVNVPERMWLEKIKVASDPEFHQRARLDAATRERLIRHCEDFRTNVSKLSERSEDSSGGFRQLAEQAVEEIEATLSPAGQNQLESQAYRNLELHIFLRDEVVSRLQISESQHRALKNLLIDSLPVLSGIDRKLARAAPEVRRRFIQQRANLLAEQFVQAHEILEPHQWSQLETFWGKGRAVDPTRRVAQAHLRP